MSKSGKLLIITLVAFAVLLLPWPDQWLGRRSSAVFKPLPPVPKIKGSFEGGDLFSIAFEYLRVHRSEFKNLHYLTVIDYTKPSSSNRLYLINLDNGAVQKLLVSHGKNSGWLYATKFSNSPESFQSSRGFFRTGSKYYGKLGPTLELVGLQKGINDNALSRKIVMHGAHYAGPHSIVMNRGRLGRSLGCPAIPRECAEAVIDRIKGGSLLYIHAKEK